MRDLDVPDKDSVRRYRLRMRNFCHGHVWEELDDNALISSDYYGHGGAVVIKALLK